MVISVILIGVFTYDAPAKVIPSLIQAYPVYWFAALVLIAMSVLAMDVLFPKKRIEDLAAAYIGLVVGLSLALLLNRAAGFVFDIRSIFVEGTRWRDLFSLMSLMILPYICVTFLLQTRDQFRFIIPYVEFSRDLKGGRPLVLDSSALIDGRISDVVDTKIIDSQFIVPQFILQEVQDIADSHDKLRRSRGRRGLDVLKKLQTDPNVDIRVHETDGDAGSKTVDQRLVELTRELNGRLLTNDVNLNKLAGIQGVAVVNLNDVANALKPRFIPGEQVRIRLIKPGEGPGQGIGYLDDGTMVVVEQGQRQIGQEVDTIVTSVLQNSAGRMIFSRLLDGTHN